MFSGAGAAKSNRPKFRRKFTGNGCQIRKRHEVALRLPLKSLIEKLRNGRDLNGADIDTAVAILLSPDVGDEVKADFLTALHRKGETTEEIAAFVQSLMKRAVDPMIDRAEMPGPMVDVCGTGGDGVDSFNISTTVAFVVAAGSADVLEQLGVPIGLAPEELRESLKRHRLGFLFARQYHPAFRALAETRGRLARQNARTIFNALGPLLNPARPSRQLIGVYSPHLTGIFAQVLRELRHERAWIVHGLGDNSGGMDDISVSGATTIAELIDDKVTSAILDVSWLGIPRAPVSELRGGDARENAATIEGILAGKISGAKRDMTIVNAAGGFVVAGLVKDLKEGIELAREEIDSGRALEKLRALQGTRL